ncbi:uncharacterized protein At4g15970-like [Pistacia vera]|uniref:uncharacterized protein At4g15970-like n=1 Tax=Pistacia vera TaxID=55513 RepID=UPI001263832A|nr:uncharacterized protein At4g15970-like [Pistacia vera]
MSNLPFQDADVMWFRNPATYIVDMKELEIVCNFYSVDPPSIASEVDGGFFYLKSNEISLDYFKNWELKRVLYPNSQNQSLCEATVTDPFFEMIGFRVKYLEESHFNGFCQQRRNMSEIVTVHANCCDSIQSKVHDLKLLHEDWRHFTALSSGKTSLRGSSVTWRVPSKCKS